MGILGSLVAPAAMALVLLLVRLAWLKPLTGFGLVMALWVTGGLAAAAIAFRAFRSGSQGASLFHGAVALVLLGSFLLIGATSRGPAIHDVTTDPDDAPEFMQAGALPENRDRDLTYPHGGAQVPAIQATAYPDLRPIRLAVEPEEAFEAARGVADELGWTVTWSNAEMGRIEAYEATALFRFVDDVAIRIRADGEGSVVDIRSTSRLGRSDLGVNAERIRRFEAALRRRTG